MFNRAASPDSSHSSISGSTYFPPPVITESTAAREALQIFGKQVPQRSGAGFKSAKTLLHLSLSAIYRLPR
jgi:hypothetical protein